jgi:2-keto-3-deoxy-L-rhamnonate aldolase RhmA
MVEASNRAGVAPGIHFLQPAQVKRAADLGCRFLVCGSDSAILLSGFRGVVQQIALKAGAEGKSGYA